MLENVKIIMDESSRQSLDMLRSNLSELLSPLRQIADFAQELADIKDSVHNQSDDMHRKINDLADSLGADQIRGSLKQVVQGQEKIFQELTKIAERTDDFKAAFAQIDWNSPVQGSK